MAYPIYPPYPAPRPQWSQPVRNTFHIVIDEETDYSQTFTDIDPSTYLPVDLTGYKAELQLRISNNNRFDGYSDPQIPVLDLNSETGGITLGGASGQITINISWQQTQNLNWNRAVYNLILISPAGNRRQFMSGFFVVNSGATKQSQTELT